MANWTRAFVGLSVVACAMSVAGEDTTPKNELEAFIEGRNTTYADALENYLENWLVDQYPDRAEQAWQRDYSSVEAFLESVKPNRERWRDIFNPPDFPVTDEVTREPHPPMAELQSEWITVSLGTLKAEGLLVMPPDAEGPVPLVIAQHGIGSWPERTFGLLDEGDAYHSYAHALIEAGFAVLAPFNLRSVPARNRIERLCRLADTTLPGIELVRLQRLLDVVLADPRIQADKVGMWGVSLGGMATMFWMPLEPRIKAGVVCAWFNHRRNKMAISDPRYSCFLDTKEEHAFFRGWLTEFADYDVISLICPRPVLVQTGKKDGIAHWPQVIEEFETARTHYEQLGMAERMEMDLHDGGHEARVESGVAFLKRWLME